MKDPLTHLKTALQKNPGDSCATRKKRIVRTITITGVSLAAILAMSGCSSPRQESSVAPPKAPKTSPGAIPQDTHAAKLRFALELHEKIQARLDSYMARYGEGTKSPCSTSSTKLLSSACSEASQALLPIAKDAFQFIQGKAGFATLSSVSEKTVEAVNDYHARGCENNPQDLEARKHCLNYGAIIAQAPRDLSDGLNLGLAGK